MSETNVQRLSIVGTGLIGASVGLAAKEAGVEVVTGHDPDPEALEKAVERRAIDRAEARLADAVAGAELVVVAAPVGAIPGVVAAAASAATGARAITDVGSTKRTICASAAANRRFVGGHPLAGSEAAGPENARADLFVGATWFLTPGEMTDPESVQLVEELVRAVGATPALLTAEQHDGVVALTSHLPHALANALVSQVASARIDDLDPLEVTGASFRDLTRVAGANPALWADIFLDNADVLADALADLREELERIEGALRARDARAVRAGIDRAAGHRRRMSPG